MKLIIIKIGGNVIDNPAACEQFLKDFAELPSPKILVHGGGKVATQVAEKLGIETVMVDGRRITDKAMLDVVTMVYGGLVNKSLVGQLQALSCNAIGLTGADGGVILAHKRVVGAIDYGFVGDIDQVNHQFITTLLSQGLTPIFAPLTFDSHGTMLNTNADTQASAIAVALASDFDVSLTYCFEKKGVLSDPSDDEAVIAELTPSSYANYKTNGVINKGMIPKLDNAFKALAEGVKEVIICHAADVKTEEKGTRLSLEL